MALIKYSALLSFIWGKMNGTIFTANKIGYIIKSNTTPCDRKTNKQSISRADFKYFANKWRTLTPTQRIHWDNLAATIIKHNIFGDPYFMTGFNLYMERNLSSATIHRGYLSNPIGNVTPLPFPANYSILLSKMSNMVIINFPSFTVPANTCYNIYATPCMSPGVTYKKSNLNFIKEIPVGTANTINIYTEYIAKYGQLIPNSNIFFSIKGVNTADLTQGGHQYFKAFLPTIEAGIGYMTIGTTFTIN